MATISKKQSYFSFKEGVVREEIIKRRHKPEPRNLAGWWVLSVCLLGNTFLCLWTNMEQYPSAFSHSTLLHLCSISLWGKWTKEVGFSLGYVPYRDDSVNLPLLFWLKCKGDMWSRWSGWYQPLRYLELNLFNKFSLRWPLKTQFQRIPLLVDVLLLDEQWGSRTIVRAIVILSFCSGLSLQSTEIWILEELLI